VTGIYRAKSYRVPFAVCLQKNARQSHCRAFSSFCRAPETHGKARVSRSERCYRKGFEVTCQSPPGGASRLTLGTTTEGPEVLDISVNGPYHTVRIRSPVQSFNFDREHDQGVNPCPGFRQAIYTCSPSWRTFNSPPHRVRLPRLSRAGQRGRSRSGDTALGARAQCPLAGTGRRT
jgi:hypothetical protein